MRIGVSCGCYYLINVGDPPPEILVQAISGGGVIGGTIKQKKKKAYRVVCAGPSLRHKLVMQCLRATTKWKEIKYKWMLVY